MTQPAKGISILNNYPIDKPKTQAVEKTKERIKKILDMQVVAFMDNDYITGLDLMADNLLSLIDEEKVEAYKKGYIDAEIQKSPNEKFQDGIQEMLYEKSLTNSKEK